MRFELPTARYSVSLQGKFFFRSGRKFFLKAMRLDDLGGTLDFSGKLRLRRRLEELKAGHTSGLVLTEAQSQPAIDVVAAAAMIAIVELQVAPADLEDNAGFGSIVSRFAHSANINRGHTALAGYLIDCPLEAADLARIGVQRIRRRLGHLVRILKRHDEGALVAIRHSPETLDFALAEEDFLYLKTTASESQPFRNLILRLHQLAGARPIVVEFTQPSPEQDEAVAVAFGTGGAGVVAPPVPAPASHDWLNIRALRQPDRLPFINLNGSCPPQLEQTPKVSVVVCAHNERAITQCLESLVRLEYPDYEVIVVDDGSNKGAVDIARKFPQFRLLRQLNLGVSAARNTALKAARGNIIAYLKSDCVADPQWLTYLVRSMEEERLDACAGPVYPSQRASVPGICAAAAGVPSLGSNLAFRREALLAAGGFDPAFERDGGEIDLGWRMDDARMRSGYSPAAVVWRSGGTMSDYFSRQADYAHGEAVLSERNPERFSFLGLGSSPSIAIGQAEALPRMPGWMIFWLAAATLIAVSGVTPIPILGFLLAAAVFAIADARRATLPHQVSGIAPRVLIAILACAGPIWRSLVLQRVRLQRWNSRFANQLPAEMVRSSEAQLSRRVQEYAPAYSDRAAVPPPVPKQAAHATHKLSVSH